MYVYLLFDQTAAECVGIDCAEEVVDGVYATAEQAIGSALTALPGTEEDLFEIENARLWFIGDEDEPIYVVKRYQIKGSVVNEVNVE